MYEEELSEDPMNVAMRSYLESDKYLIRRKTINEMDRLFRTGLTPDQKRAFRQLMDEIYGADNEFARMAYLAGCHYNRNIDS